MDYVPESEASPRLTQQLSQLARGAAVLGARTEVNQEDIRLIRRVAFDCLPPARKAIIECLNRAAGATVTQANLIPQTQIEKSMMSRQLEELSSLGLVARTDAGDFANATCRLSEDAQRLLSVGLNS